MVNMKIPRLGQTGSSAQPLLWEIDPDSLQGGGSAPTSIYPLDTIVPSSGHSVISASHGYSILSDCDDVAQRASQSDVQGAPPASSDLVMVQCEDGVTSGTCYCAWSLPGWSTPPGGDQQKWRRRRALCISVTIISTIFCIIIGICSYGGQFALGRVPLNATFHSLHIVINRDVKIQILDDITVPSTNDTVAQLLNIVVGRTIPQHIPYSLKYSEDGSSLEMKFLRYASMVLRHSWINNEVQCYNISWINFEGQRLLFEDSVQLGDSHWYGSVLGGFSPLWHNDFFKMPKSLTAFFQNGNNGAAVNDRPVYCLSSLGVSVFASQYNSSVVANRNPRRYISLQSNIKKSPSEGNFQYVICQSIDQSIVTLHKAMAQFFLQKPQQVPNSHWFNHSIVSTGFMKSVTQDRVVEMARDLQVHGFSPAQIVIDNGWEKRLGDMDFDKERFPDPALMVSVLYENNVYLTLKTHPFASLLSNSFIEGTKRGFWVKNWLFDVPSLLVWEGKLGSVLDITNPEAFQWFSEKLAHLQDYYNIHSMLLESGRLTNYEWQRINSKALTIPPENISCALFDNCSPYALNKTISRYIQMSRKTFIRNYPGVLKTVIPHILTMGLLGQLFVAPELVDYSSYESSNIPSRELFIRWVELTALLPFWKLPITPWHYDEEVTKIALNMYQLHQSYVSKMVTLAVDSLRTGLPLIRPLWWICPFDEHCHKSDSQFVVGEDILVAPILEEGARKRDIYIPVGTWIDQVDGSVYRGPGWIRNHPAKLEDIPHFILEGA